MDIDLVHVKVMLSGAFGLSLNCCRLLLQVDVYSFGVIMWEVTSHEQPARGRMRDLKVPQECPAEINDLINRCLSEDPAHRPSAREAYDVLKTWRDKHADFLSKMRNSLGRESSLCKDSDSAYDSGATQKSATLRDCSSVEM